MLGQVALRPAKLGEAKELAKLHVSVWRETYAGLAPKEAYDRLDVARRLPAWEASLCDANQRVVVEAVFG